MKPTTLIIGVLLLAAMVVLAGAAMVVLAVAAPVEYSEEYCAARDNATTYAKYGDEAFSAVSEAGSGAMATFWELRRQSILLEKQNELLAEQNELTKRQMMGWSTNFTCSNNDRSLVVPCEIANPAMRWRIEVSTS